MTHCFAAGTQILTPSGEAGVEALAIGDVVETLHGGRQNIKWIGRRHCAETSGMPIRFEKDALDDGIPAAVLRVSPGHGICIDGVLIPAGRLVNGVTITQEGAAAAVAYYHIELAEHEVLFANACPAESFHDERYRTQFDNFVEYQALFPHKPAPAVPCLERLEDGFVLHAIQHRLAERAGLPPVVPDHGPLRGFLDQAGPVIVTGWAQCVTQPEEPVCLDILVDNVRILRALANRYRDDLRLAGLGSGNHGFFVQLPEDFSGIVEVRRTFDQAVLPLTPKGDYA
jgi:hypothetical protein